MVETNNITNESTDLMIAIKSLKDNTWWKYLMTLLNKTKENIIEQILMPRTDQRLAFSADNLLKERLEVINIIINLPDTQIRELENRIQVLSERSRPLDERIKEYGEKFSEEIIKRDLNK